MEQAAFGSMRARWAAAGRQEWGGRAGRDAGEDIAAGTFCMLLQ